MSALPVVERAEAGGIIHNVGVVVGDGSMRVRDGVDDTMSNGHNGGGTVVGGKSNANHEGNNMAVNEHGNGTLAEDAINESVESNTLGMGISMVIVEGNVSHLEGDTMTSGIGIANVMGDASGTHI